VRRGQRVYRGDFFRAASALLVYGGEYQQGNYRANSRRQNRRVHLRQMRSGQVEFEEKERAFHPGGTPVLRVLLRGLAAVAVGIAAGARIAGAAMRIAAGTWRSALLLMHAVFLF